MSGSIAAVIGSPISHSLSPAIFSFLAQRAGLGDFSYEAREVGAGELGRFLDTARETPGLVGFNVTIPHKEAVLAGADEADPSARAIGAVNVVRVAGGRLLGFNTDAEGVAGTLRNSGFDSPGKSAWIWGAGGAARAVAYVLGRDAARTVHVSNRDRDRAQRIAREMGALFPRTAFVAVMGPQSPVDGPVDLLVNATPVGMKPGGAELSEVFAPMRALRLSRRALALDLIYNPQETLFLRLARDRGLRPVGGMEMLIVQALATWEFWFGAASRAALGEGVEGALSAHLLAWLARPRERAAERPIFLTGFMGVGKSCIGSLLAEKLGWEFVDTDELVEISAGASVARIFEEKGEPAFREVERAAVLQAARLRKTVVALGGGALMDPRSLRTVQGAGELVFLSASVELLAERLSRGGSKRPLAAGRDRTALQEMVHRSLSERQAIYEQAGIRIEIDKHEAREVAERIAVALGRADP